MQLNRGINTTDFCTNILIAVLTLKQHTYNNCPVCSYPLTEQSAVCPRCGNDILRDISSLDEQSQEKHLKIIDEKKAEWYARCMADKLNCCEMEPSTCKEEDFTCHVSSERGGKLVDAPVFSLPRKQLLEERSKRNEWWNTLNSDWKEVVKSTLKISCDPSDQELLGFFDTTHLRCDNRRVYSLAPLRVLEKLQQLRCDESPIESLEPLKELKLLQRLYAFDCDFSSLEPLSGITSLKLLWISSTEVNSLEPVAHLVNLEELYCSETPVGDLSPVSGLTSLEKISCYKTAVSSLAPLEKLENLIELGFNSTQIDDLSPLAGIENLEYLRFSRTAISSLEPLSGLINLRELSFNETTVDSLEPLAGLPELEEISFANTRITSIAPLMHLEYLEKIELSAGQVPNGELEQFLELHPDCEIILKK